MRRTLHRQRISLTGVLLCLLPAPLSLAGGLSEDLRQRLQAPGADDEIPVIVRFTARGPLSGPATGERAALRRDLILGRRAVAAESQRPLRSFLRGRGIAEPVSLWLINALAFQANRATLLELARWPGVEWMGLDRTLREPHRPAGAPALRLETDRLVTTADPEWNVDLINAPALWALGFSGAGLVIGSMDSGADAAQQDLQGSWRGGGNSWLDPNNQHATPYDRSGHGTQTLGLITGGGLGGTAIGVAPQARWIAAKIFNDAGNATYAGIHLGFQWMLDPDGDPGTDDGADVVNNSWGFEDQAGECVDEFEDDVAALRAAGVAVVSSAGNGGPLPSSSVSPANYPEGLAVGAVDILPAVDDFSGRGPAACGGGLYPGMVAPGVDVRTADLTFGGAFPGSYTYATGTSFAAPHVAGGIALLAQAFPAATVGQLEAAVTSTAHDLGGVGPDNESGHGLIDLLAAHGWLAAGGACSDADADGRAPEGGVCGGIDCDDGSAGVWEVPGEAASLIFLSDTGLDWSEPATPGGIAGSLRYDVLRSSDPDDFLDTATCLESDDPLDTTAIDPETPPPGSAFYYLVRAENGCPGGQGSLGQASDGTERSGRGCGV